MRIAIAILAVLLVGCDSSVSPTPVPTSISVAQVATPSPAASSTPSSKPTASAAETPAATPKATPAATASAQATVAPPAKLAATIANATKIRYFTVTGTTPNDLLDQVVMQSKPFCKTSDTLACVANAYEIRWTRVTNLATGSCKVTAESISLKSTVSLPRWTGPAHVPAALVTWWKKMFDHFAWHEGQHIKIQRSYDKKLKSLLIGHKCSSANGIIASWERSLQAAQAKFDKQDQSWPYPLYAGT